MLLNYRKEILFHVLISNALNLCHLFWQYIFSENVGSDFNCESVTVFNKSFDFFGVLLNYRKEILFHVLISNALNLCHLFWQYIFSENVGSDFNCESVTVFNKSFDFFGVLLNYRKEILFHVLISNALNLGYLFWQYIFRENFGSDFNCESVTVFSNVVRTRSALQK